VNFPTSNDTKHMPPESIRSGSGFDRKKVSNTPDLASPIAHCSGSNLLWRSDHERGVGFFPLIAEAKFQAGRLAFVIRFRVQVDVPFVKVAIT